MVNTILDEMTEAMCRGDRVELRGFGTFTVKKREARTGRNPMTGESVAVLVRYIPAFRVSIRSRARHYQPPGTPHHRWDDGRTR